MNNIHALYMIIDNDYSMNYTFIIHHEWIFIPLEYSMNNQKSVYYTLFNVYSKIHWIYIECSLNIWIYIDYCTRDFPILKIEYSMIIHQIIHWLFIKNEYSSLWNIQWIFKKTCIIHYSLIISLVNKHRIFNDYLMNNHWIIIDYSMIIRCI